MELGRRIAKVMRLDPSAPAVYYDGSWSSWGDLTLTGDTIAELTSELDHDVPIALVARNRPLIMGALLGCLARRRPVIILSSLHPDEALAAEIVALRPTTVIANSEDWARAGFRDAVAQVQAQGIEVGADLNAHAQLVPGLERTGSGRRATVPPDAAISLQTSGTTGPPKRIVMTNANLEASIDGVVKHYSDRAADRPPRLSRHATLQMLPLSHTSALLGVTLAVAQGRKIVLFDRFDAMAFGRAVRDHGLATAGLPPAALRMVLDAEVPKEWLTTLRTVRSGTAPMPDGLAVEFETRYGIPVLQAYGATEFQGLASWTLKDYEEYGEQKRGSVGRAHPGVDLRVVSPDTFGPLPPGSSGVLEVRSRQAAGHDSNAWVRTSDLARVDAEGFVWIEGRVDDVINRGGFKIDADEVVARLRVHTKVADAAVVGLDDRRLGQIPVAAIVPADPNDPPTYEDLTAWVRQELEPYKSPVRVVIVDALPQNASMKVAKRDVVALFDKEIVD